MEKELLGVGSRVKHAAFGEGVVTRLHLAAYEVCFMQYGLKNVGKDAANWEIIEAIAADSAVTFSEAEKSLARVLRAWLDTSEIIPIHEKWRGGKLIMEAGETNLQGKELPIETFFHKIVMVRDRIRVMEQKINASKLQEDEKIDLQQYITKIYGSLTTFNVLFKEKEDYFTGEKTK